MPMEEERADVLSGATVGGQALTTTALPLRLFRRLHESNFGRFKLFFLISRLGHFFGESLFSLLDD